jgi:hypothetical protein
VIPLSEAEPDAVAERTEVPSSNLGAPTAIAGHWRAAVTARRRPKPAIPLAVLPDRQSRVVSGSGSASRVGVVDDLAIQATTAERVARNDATFRAANEKIRVAAETFAATVERVPFICECAEERCVEVVRLDLEQYREIRSNRRWFLNVPGHEVAARGWGEVVATRQEYVIVEKLGIAGEIAEELAGERDIGIDSG